MAPEVLTPAHPQQPYEALLEGRINTVPIIMVGTCGGDGDCNDDDDDDDHYHHNDNYDDHNDKYGDNDDSNDVHDNDPYDLSTVGSCME
jgi:hypothetical protein